jgi:hypothetical protein
MEREMKIYLKIKIMSLTAEARIIRAEEKKWPGEHDARLGLHRHRVHEVRPEARHALLAYGFLRGRDYRQLEFKAARAPDWDRVQKLVEKFGAATKADLPIVAQRFAQWRDAAMQPA